MPVWVIACPGSVRASFRSSPIGSAEQALSSAQTNPELTFKPDHPMGADHRRHGLSVHAASLSSNCAAATATDKKEHIHHATSTRAQKIELRSTRAEPPADADPALRPWFELLKRPGSGASCCTIADCRPVSYRISADGYEALVGSIWISVPKDTVLRSQHNPLGRAVLCRSPVGTIFCFVPGPEV